jgi:hypothetical protein
LKTQYKTNTSSLCGRNQTTNYFSPQSPFINCNANLNFHMMSLKPFGCLFCHLKGWKSLLTKWYVVNVHIKDFVECVFQGYEVLATCCKQGILMIPFDKPRMNISNILQIYWKGDKWIFDILNSSLILIRQGYPQLEYKCFY